MSVVPSLYVGMTGSSQANVNIPTSGFNDTLFHNRNPALGTVKYQIAPPLLNPALDYSTRDGVLPCYGITHHVLRQDNPVPASNAYQAPMGVGRGQERGLQYSVPLNNPIMPYASSVFAGLNNPLGRPM